MKLAESVIAWTPANKGVGSPGYRGKVRVFHAPQPAEHTGGFSCYAGRGDEPASHADLAVRRRHVRLIANRMIQDDGLDAAAVHAALSAIDEFALGLDEQPIAQTAPQVIR